MIFFRKAKVCVDCGCYFEPNFISNYKDRCKVHSQTQAEEDAKNKKFWRWCDANRKRLEEEMNMETRNLYQIQKDYEKSMQDLIQQKGDAT